MNVPVADFLLVAWAAAVALCDCRSRRIPNSLVVAGLVAAFAVAFLQRNPFDVSMGQAALGFAIGLVVLLPLFVLGVMGAADVKVFAVLGAWCGVHALFGLWVAASILGGMHAVWVLLSTRTRLASLGRQRGPTFAVGEKRATPYAACLTAAAVALLVLHGVAGSVR
ncbi:prepilin peptidase [Paraburkholderia sp. DHOC27]|uniref:A24 family peptidase n=1 Tax=Paraburkholderia sp. DHOC27 TaxID=2303330 RepID=UPI000E3D6C18|nr:A24 family peptidase [Paraburkholderia sp. DHOC27]RFU47983.1 prepilin peptidase [Paraburkholderia sp. DHOC27]